MRAALLLLVACGADPLHQDPTPEMSARVVSFDVTDTFLHGISPATTWGGFHGVYFGEAGQWRPLVRLPAVDGATAARFYFYVAELDRPRLLTAFRVTTSWLEGDGDNPTYETADGCTWNTPWQVPGASSPDVDFLVEPSAPTVLVDLGWNVLHLPPEWLGGDGFVMFDSSGPGHGWFWSSEGRTAYRGRPEAELPYFEADIR